MIVEIDKLTISEIASICDHTSLMPPESKKYQIPGKNPNELRERDLMNFMQDAVFGSLYYRAICIRGVETGLARNYLDKNESKLLLAVTTGFPNLEGNLSLEQKIKETHSAIKAGADEIDWVMNWDYFRTGSYLALRNEIITMSELIKSHKRVSKMILEVCKLTPDEIKTATQFADLYGVDFVKTSTGFAESGASEESLEIMRLYSTRGIKAAGGIKLNNVKNILKKMSRENNGMIDLDPKKYALGESSLFNSPATTGKY
jgi:deoxyribose-phosphate aldolase